MAELDREKIKTLLKGKGLTPRAASRQLGSNPYLLRDILGGKSRHARSDTIAKLADLLQVPAAELYEPDPAGGDVVHVTADPRSRQIVPRFLPVRFKVQAGLWYEFDPDEMESRAKVFPVLPDPRFADVPQWLEEVCGDSANLRFPEGNYVHVVDAIGLGYAPKQDNWVVVERRRAGGMLRERTIKQIAFNPEGCVELWPRSTNPKWGPPVSLLNGVPDGEHEGIEVEIVGLVIGSYSPAF